MFIVIPAMPSKTFVMVLKKLPDPFKASVDLNKCFEDIKLPFSLQMRLYFIKNPFYLAALVHTSHTVHDGTFSIHHGTYIRDGNS